MTLHPLYSKKKLSDKEYLKLMDIARENKHFELADEIRRVFIKRGFKIKNGKKGSTIHL